MPNSIVELQRIFFNSGATRSIEFRSQALYSIERWVRKNENRIAKALRADFNKPEFESYATETGIVLEEARFLRKNLRRWMKTRKVPTSFAHFPSRSYVCAEPYGVTLIMSPWNYPFQLTLTPLLGAVAAGNCAVVKPSAYAPYTSKLIHSMLGELFPPDYISVVTGGRRENQELLNEKFDYIFFTGSISVGKTVMQSAANTLTPVTLELGGKSPCIICEDADLAVAARRIVWGKFLNAGQTCVAPDYLLAHESIATKLMELICAEIKNFYGEDPRLSPDFPRIINEKHTERIAALISSGKIVAGGTVNVRERYIAPTLLSDVSWDSPIMQEEIFGPVLPVLTFSDFDQLIAHQKELSRPLALYLFTSDKRKEKKIIQSLSFGGGCVNDTIIHVGSTHLPFGGIGLSGMGSYHGKGSFDTFTHYKGIVKKSTLLDVAIRYAPYSQKSLKLVKFFLK